MLRVDGTGASGCKFKSGAVNGIPDMELELEDDAVLN